MIKRFAIASLISSVILFSTPAAGRDPIDLVVALDTSASMYSSYKEVSDYIVGPLLTEFLKIGDTFHLISFSDVAKNEISCKIDGYGDVKTVIGRLMLMYPLDPHTDFIAALDTLYRYLRELPESRSKTVLLISDGEHFPPGKSPNATLTPAETVQKIDSTTERLKGNGWNFYFIKVPFSGQQPLPKLEVGGLKEEKATTKPSTSTEKATPATTPATATPPSKTTIETTTQIQPEKETAKPVDVTDIVAETLSTPVVEWKKEDGSNNIGAAVGVVFAEFPSSMGKISRNFSIPVQISNPSESEMYIETLSVLVDGTDRMAKKSFLTLKPRSENTLKLYIQLPDSYPAEPSKLTITPHLDSNIRLMPGEASIAADIQDSFLADFSAAISPYLTIIVIIIVALILILLLLLFLKRFMSATPEKTAAKVTRQAVDKPGPGKTSGSSPAMMLPARLDVTTKTLAKLPAQAAEEPHKKPQDESSKKKKVAKQSLPTFLSGPPATSPTSASAAHSGLPIGIAPLKGGKTKTSSSYDYAVTKENERIMIELWVQDQNRQIGRRNVHIMKSGATLTLGGGRSDFLIFLVPIPQKIADIHYNGTTCALIPKQPDFFPDLEGSPLEDCVGKKIRIVSDKNHELFIKFEVFEDPLVKLNNLLRSIDKEGY